MTKDTLNVFKVPDVTFICFLNFNLEHSQEQRELKYEIDVSCLCKAKPKEDFKGVTTVNPVR